jgi:hypothetical protein
MPADHPLPGSVIEPDELKIIGQAFDQAWSIVKPSLADRPLEHDAARLKLATIILAARGERRPLDPAQLRDSAVASYRQGEVGAGMGRLSA